MVKNNKIRVLKSNTLILKVLFYLFLGDNDFIINVGFSKVIMFSNAII